MKKAIILIALFAGTTAAQAQNDIDALRYSVKDPLGSTARSMGMGGAIGALGADPSSVLVNPAALAQYKSNVFAFSAGMATLQNNADYLSSDRRSNGYSAEIPSINLVFTDRKMRRDEPRKSGWVNTNLIIGYNKVSDFDRNMSYSGLNTSSSYLDYISDYVQGYSASTLDADEEQLRDGFNYFENMFWYSYLIDTVSNGEYFPNYNTDAPMQDQQGTVNTKGGMSELNLAFAANYEHKFYLGFGLNVDQLNYTELNTFSEVNLSSAGDSWREFEFDRHLSSSGHGFSGRLGLMFRPSDAFRIGASVSTPKLLTIEDNYYDELQVIYDDGDVENLTTIDKYFNYTVVTPMSYNLQAAFILGKLGIVSAEVERVDYSTMMIMSNDADFADVNQAIADKYTSSTNLKLGAEMALGTFRLRGGLAHVGSPFAGENSFSRNFGTLGFGISERSWGLDVAYTNQWAKDSYKPYEVGSNSPVAQSDFNQTRIVLTLTSKF